MGKYILRRLLIAIPTLLAITFVVFAILSLAPTDPLSQFGADPRVPPEVRERIREALGLNDPWPIRYVKWLTSLFRGDFGVSFMSHSSVSDLILQRLPNTLAVVGVAYFIGVLIGVPAGMLSAVKPFHVLDQPAPLLVALGIPTIFGGAIVTEQIFRVPGIGELLVTAIGNGDTPVVTAVLFIFAVLVVLFNLMADVLYTVLDPRLRLA